MQAILNMNGTKPRGSFITTSLLDLRDRPNKEELENSFDLKKYIATWWMH